jgi:SpoVK/Ycf46/Vps4 family AAA+-type ATPase
MGESEKNFRLAMNTAERLAPCVLFIDELEKAFASGGSEDGGVSQRVLGTFLSWMQDRKADVFTVATANDVTRLPAEFLRKGRFDEVFFVDLPNDEARQAILRIHLKKRSQNPDSFDLDALTHATDGFSGAEIEQAIVSALYTAFADRKSLSSQILCAEIAATKPLSRTMAERVAAIRAWAVGRTVGAN